MLAVSSYLPQHVWTLRSSRFPLVRPGACSGPRELPPHHGGPPGGRGDLRRAPLCPPDSERRRLLPLPAPANRPGRRIFSARQAFLWKPWDNTVVSGDVCAHVFVCTCVWGQVTEKVRGPLFKSNPRCFNVFPVPVTCEFLSCYNILRLMSQAPL